MPGCRGWCALLLLLTLAPAAAAVEGTTPADRATMTVVPPRVHTLAVGVNYEWFGMLRQTDRPWQTRESGMVPTYALTYRYRDDASPLTITAGMELANIVVDYRANDDVQNLSLADRTATHLLMDYAATVGWRLVPNPGKALTVTPYLGGGYQRWERRADIRERYTWFSVIFGVRLDYPLGSGWDVGLDLSGRRQLDATKQTWLSDANAAYDNHELDLTEHTGFRAELPLSYRYTDGLTVTLAPWGELQPLGKSDAAALTAGGAPAGANLAYDGVTRDVDQEPATRRLRYGAQVALSF